MPKSKVRKRSDYVAPKVPASTASVGRAGAPSPVWYPVFMAIVLVLGLAWISTYYIAGERVPVMQDLGAWNFGIGFGLMIAGLFMAVRWR